MHKCVMLCVYDISKFITHVQKLYKYQKQYRKHEYCICILQVSGMNPAVCTHREIFLNQPEIRFYLPFSDWFGQTDVRFVPNQSENSK